MTSILVAGFELSLVLSMRRKAISWASDERARTSLLSHPRTVIWPDITQRVSVTWGSASVDRSIFPGVLLSFLPSRAVAALPKGAAPIEWLTTPAKDIVRPNKIGKAKDFIVNLVPGPFSVSGYKLARQLWYLGGLPCSHKQQT